MFFPELWWTKSIIFWASSLFRSHSARLRHIRRTNRLPVIGSFLHTILSAADGPARSGGPQHGEREVGGDGAAPAGFPCLAPTI